MYVIETLRAHEGEIKERYSVRRIGVFGSYVRGEQKATSDIDVLVEFEKPTFDNFMDLAFYLEELFGRRVDLLTSEGVKGIRIKEIAKRNYGGCGLCLILLGARGIPSRNH